MKNLILFVAARPSARSLMVFVVMALGISLLSCTHNPVNGKLPDSRASIAGKGQKVEEVPQPGDVKIVDGAEYIYTRNIKYQVTPYEPEYMWVPKKDYTPGASERLKNASAEKDDLAPLRKRIEKLEEELRKQDNATTGGVKAAQ